MFNLYQNFSKNKEDYEYHKETEVTGHDRFCQERPGTRKKRKNVGRRTQSAIELDSGAMLTARSVLQRGRSASIEEDDSEEEKSFPLTNKIDSLAKILFNRVSSARGCRENEVRNGKHQYTALGNGPSGCDDAGEYVEMEKRSRDRALSICTTYIHGTSRYNLLKQLNNIGSRMDKHWFIVRDTSLKTDRILTLTPLSKNCPLEITPSTKDVLNHLFLVLQHPYISPVLDLEFIEYEGMNYAILLQPINQGSLKDLIYEIGRNCWNEDWSQKYAARGKGLPLPQIQQMGRQILEALVFLKERGFPTVTHLHSGNVVVQNGVARLAGLENSLLGFTSRTHPIITSRLAHHNSMDTICFGHMLFEMCTGYELSSFKPSSVHFTDLQKYPQVSRFLKYLFEGPRYPSVEELIIHDLFRNIDLRELRSAPVTIFRPTLTPSIVNLLDGIKRSNSSTRRHRHRSRSSKEVLIERRY